MQWGLGAYSPQPLALTGPNGQTLHGLHSLDGSLLISIPRLRSWPALVAELGRLRNNARLLIEALSFSSVLVRLYSGVTSEFCICRIGSTQALP